MVHLKQPQLSGLARNPAAPPDVLYTSGRARGGPAWVGDAQGSAAGCGGRGPAGARRQRVGGAPVPKPGLPGYAHPNRRAPRPGDPRCPCGLHPVHGGARGADEHREPRRSLRPAAGRARGRLRSQAARDGRACLAGAADNRAASSPYLAATRGPMAARMPGLSWRRPGRTVTPAATEPYAPTSARSAQPRYAGGRLIDEAAPPRRAGWALRAGRRRPPTPVTARCARTSGRRCS